MNQNSPGIIKKDEDADYLYRVALRALIRDETGRILVVKEKGRDWWDLPGGGLEYGESIKDGLARELKEEIGLSDDFDHTIAILQNPEWNERIGAMQINAIFEVKTNISGSIHGTDSQEVAFMSREEIVQTTPPQTKLRKQLESLI